jgi:hypothetical protein
LKDDITKLLHTLNNLSELERQYFIEQTAFIIKEMFAQKIGNFANSTHHKNNVYGYSGLWLLNLEEKISQFSIIPYLKINYDESDFSNMYIKFDMKKNGDDDENDITYYAPTTTFRRGDICIVYAMNDGNNIINPIDEQIFRGKILEINSEYVIVNFRNKLNKEKFNVMNK